ncbi:MAG TPA: sulfotransferase, partial [Acidimicrobiales bacterium]|nr:sulfotransferase [Acidimicrobiales bacterium]
VVIHRDPVLLCGSVFSLIRGLSSTFSDADHTRYITDHWTEMLQLCIDRTEAFRAAHPEHPLIDVRYDDLVKDPVGTVAGIYQAAGESLTSEARAAMSGYMAAHPKGQLGDHRYDLADFGVQREDIAQRFAGYAERYGV